VLVAFPGLLSLLFGDQFLTFTSIIIPFGVGQVLAAPVFALMLYLKAERRGRTIFWLGTLSALLYLAFSTILGSLFGLKGAAWAGAAAAALGGIILIAVLRRATK
jgi:O-antigen/teichoic acid export membrane protein